ncbi:hypothetical protein ACFS5M_09695 [Lacinutrix iliipiscaria]|uniref:DUF4349 domain-containing protein n=1 Tax=Lacinutrix iliipiscaria TaxID=1230532 RepID=A0ABW5WRK4_9FLAO
MKYSINILLFLIIFSCKNDNIESEIVSAYYISAETENDTIQIDSINILKKTTVDFDFILNTRINSLNHGIELEQIVLDKLNEKRELLNNVMNYSKSKKILSKIEQYQKSLDSTELFIKSIENEIAKYHQKIVLTKAYIGNENDNSFELYDYVFYGAVNGENRIDSMSILRREQNDLKFTRNNRLTNYKGE